MPIKRFLIIASTLIVCGPNSVANSGDFSCPGFKQGACLDYGDKVCSSSGKCVNQSAECFGPYTCNYKGFICKSKFDDLVEKYEDLAIKARSVASEYDLLVSKYNSLVLDNSSIKNCISHASSIDEAQQCIW